MAFAEENEVSANANGGTEITKRTLAPLIDEKLASQFQIVPSRVRELRDDAIRVYWAHDLPEDPECAWLSSVDSRSRFHSLVFSSNWQLQEFNRSLGVPLNSATHVIETPLTPLELVTKPEDRVDLVYISTPQRGLEILVPVFEELVKTHPEIHLHVYSSFRIYGWDDADKLFEPLYDRIRAHPSMTYHGSVSQDELRSALPRYHVLAYPSIWRETSCRALIESMSAGLMCVHPNFAALPDTSGGLTLQYQYHEDANDHANVFYQALDRAVTDVRNHEVQRYLRFVKAYADTRFNVEKISAQWTSLMTELLMKYPDAASRAAVETLSYDIMVR
jgi:UDP-glucose:(glucosyl)LPS alpha-1,2-glucosyltransferase